MPQLGDVAQVQGRLRSKVVPFSLLSLEFHQLNISLMLNFLKQLFGASSPAFTPEQLMNGTVLDVRTVGEFQGGHVPGAKNIPLDQLSAAREKVSELPLPIITCCASGRRSGIAASQLRTAGIAAINGGSWQNVATASKNN